MSGAYFSISGGNLAERPHRSPRWCPSPSTAGQCCHHLQAQSARRPFARSRDKHGIARESLVAMDTIFALSVEVISFGAAMIRGYGNTESYPARHRDFPSFIDSSGIALLL